MSILCQIKKEYARMSVMKHYFEYDWGYDDSAYPIFKYGNTTENNISQQNLY